MFDIFGHFVLDNVTYDPKEKVIINVIGPWSGETGYIIEYLGSDFYRVKGLIWRAHSMILSAKSLGNVECVRSAGKNACELPSARHCRVTRLGVPIGFDPKFP
jgi:hypothetical protein